MDGLIPAASSLATGSPSPDAGAARHTKHEQSLGPQMPSHPDHTWWSWSSWDLQAFTGNLPRTGPVFTGMTHKSWQRAQTRLGAMATACLTRVPATEPTARQTCLLMVREASPFRVPCATLLLFLIFCLNTLVGAGDVAWMPSRWVTSGCRG